MSHPIARPPSPSGATGRELIVLHRLHRAVITIRDHERRPAMLDGVALLVDLIETRNRQRSSPGNSAHENNNPCYW